MALFAVFAFVLGMKLVLYFLHVCVVLFVLVVTFLCIIIVSVWELVSRKGINNLY